MELLDITSVARSLRVELMPEPHIHSEVELNLVTAGRMTYLFGGEVRSLKAGELGIFWGTVPHRVVEVDEPTSFVCLYLPVETFLAGSAGEPFKAAVLGGRLLRAAVVEEADTSLFLRWHRDLATGDGRRVELVRQEVASRLRRVDLEGWVELGQAAGEPGPRPRARGMAKAQLMARHVAQNLGGPLTLAGIAAAAGLHPNYAMSLFKDALGVTVGQYVTRQRLGRARALLLSTDRDVAGIAFESGFGSLSRFYEAFRRHVGHTPAEYRRLHGAATASARAGRPG